MSTTSVALLSIKEEVAFACHAITKGREEHIPTAPQNKQAGYCEGLDLSARILRHG